MVYLSYTKHGAWPRVRKANPMSSPKNVNPRARLLVQKAMQEGMELEEIATLCGVAVGSVKRWLTTGRADSEKIRPLERKVGAVYLTADVVADVLDKIYRHRNRRFRVSKDQIRRISGRQDLRTAFLDELAEGLENRGYYLLPAHFEGKEFFLLVSRTQMLNHVREDLDDDGVDDYYQDAPDAPPED